MPRRENEKPTNLRFIVDSGASRHVVNNEKYFAKGTLVRKDGTVHSISGSEMAIKGVGSVKLSFKNSEWLLSKVLYVPDATENLISVKSAAKSGTLFEFTNDGCKVFGANGEICSANGYDNLYFLYGIYEGQGEISMIPKSSLKNYGFVGLSIATLHKRLGHASESVIRRMIGKELVTGCNVNLLEKMPFCQHCASGKMKALPHKPLEAIRSSAPFYRCHMDSVSQTVVRAPFLVLGMEARTTGAPLINGKIQQKR